ncbi:hypothetical protein CH294_22955 [Rhodococcus sp. 14-2483-1-1]|nr:hypothetical protein CH294_22955 [Rhodococcus sp. 14-2483-1-1]
MMRRLVGKIRRTKAEFTSVLADWLKTNPVKSTRGDGSYDRTQATESGTTKPAIEAYADAH